MGSTGSYATGRSRTVSVSGTVNLPSSFDPDPDRFRSFNYEWSGGVLSYSFYYTATRGCAFVEFGGIRINFGASGPYESPLYHDFQDSWSVMAGIDRPVILGSDFYQFRDWYLMASDAEYPGSGGGVSGTFSISFKVKQYRTISQVEPYSLDESDGEPTYYNQFIEKVDVSTPATVSLTIGGLSALLSVDMSIHAPTDFIFDQVVILGANAQVWSDQFPLTATASITATMPDGNPAVIATSDYNDGYNKVYGYSGGATVAVTGQAALTEPQIVKQISFDAYWYTPFPDIWGTCSGGLDRGSYLLYGPTAYWSDLECSPILARRPDLHYVLESNTNAFNTDQALTVNWLNRVTNPITFQICAVSGIQSTAQTTPQRCFLAYHKNVEESTFGPIMAYVASAATDFRLMANGDYLTGIRIGKSDYISIPYEAPDAVWSGEDGTSVEQGTGAEASMVTIHAAENAGGVAKLTLAGYYSIEAFRYWQLEVFGGSEEWADCQAATADVLPSYNFSSNVLTATANGAFPAQDGVTLSGGDRLLVWMETGANAKYNGVYTLTAVGDGSNPWQLTRASDADTSAEVKNGRVVLITGGSTYTGFYFNLTTPDPITLNTTALSFDVFDPNLSIKIGGKAWNFLAVPGVWTTRTLDLCAPDAGGDSGQQDSRYPFTADSLPNDAFRHWGVNGFETLKILTPAGSTMRVRSQICTSVRDTTICICARHLGWVPKTQFAIVHGPFSKRHTVAETDGRQSLEIMDVSNTFYTIADWCDEVNAIASGWYAYPDVGSHPLFDDSCPSGWIGGLGTIWDGSDWLDMGAIAINGGMGYLSIPLSQRYDFLNTHPGCGDPFTGEGYGSYGAVPFRVSKSWGFQAHGLCFDGLLPAAGVTVTIDGHGSGVSRDDGYFITGAPYVEGNIGSIPVSDDTGGRASIIFTNRDRRRGSLTGGAGKIASLYGDTFGQVHEVSVDVNGYIVYQRSIGAPVGGYTISTRVAAGSNPVIARGAYERLWVIFELRSDLYVTYSSDEGATWSTPVLTVSGGTMPALCSNSFGTLLCLARIEATGKIQVSRWRTGTDPSSPETFTLKVKSGASLVDLTIEAQGIGLADDKSSALLWHMSAVPTGETSQSRYFSSDDGETWTAVA